MSTPNLGLVVHSDLTFDGYALPTFIDQVNANNALVDAAQGVTATARAAIGSNASAAKTAVSSTILSASALTKFTASGKILVESIILNTDATGLAGGTNFNVLKNASVILAETVANLGASAEILGSAASVTPFTPVILDDGDVIKLQSTVAPCTGAGVLTVTVIGRKITANASLS